VRRRSASRLRSPRCCNSGRDTAACCDIAVARDTASEREQPRVSARRASCYFDMMHLARSLIVIPLLAACAGAPTHPAMPEPPVTPACGSDVGPAAPSMVHGVVSDERSGEPLPGVTVIATSPAIPNAQTVITDDVGAYKLVLPAGRYLVTFYYLDFTIQRTDVPVLGGCDTPVFQRIDPAAQNGRETILI